jgi:hypothetical protein
MNSTADNEGDRDYGYSPDPEPTSRPDDRSFHGSTSATKTYTKHKGKSTEKNPYSKERHKSVRGSTRSDRHDDGDSYGGEEYQGQGQHPDEQDSGDWNGYCGQTSDDYYRQYY